MPAGQPTKYKPEFCEMLIEHMKFYSFESFAGLDEVDVHKETLYEWAKVHPEFSEAKKKAFAKNLLRLEKKLVQAEEYDQDEKIQINTTPIIFQLRCRHKWTVNPENKEIDVNNAAQGPQVVITIPDNGRQAKND